jgi:hypothetical protein
MTRLIIDSKEYDRQMLYILALGNIKIGSVATFLEPIITGKLKYHRKLRYQAIWASAEALIKNPDKATIFSQRIELIKTDLTILSQVRELFWPMLADRRNHFELRASAMKLLLKSKPTSDNFLNMLWYMVSERDFQLYKYFYTTVKSWSTSRFPCYSRL